MKTLVVLLVVLLATGSAAAAEVTLSAGPLIPLLGDSLWDEGDSDAAVSGRVHFHRTSTGPVSFGPFLSVRRTTWQTGWIGMDSRHLQRGGATSDASVWEMGLLLRLRDSSAVVSPVGELSAGAAVVDLDEYDESVTPVLVAVSGGFSWRVSARLEAYVQSGATLYMGDARGVVMPVSAGVAWTFGGGLGS